jgi:hypothetical protein
MQQMVKQGWAKQVQEQRQSDEQVILAAEARAYELEEEGAEGVRQITFDDFLEAAQRRLQKGGAQEEGLSARRKAMVARQWMGLGEGQQASSKTEYERAVAKAEMAVVVEQAANYGGEWLEVYTLTPQCDGGQQPRRMLAGWGFGWHTRPTRRGSDSSSLRQRSVWPSI